MQSIVSRISQWRITMRQTFLNNWYGPQSKMYKTSSKEIETVLEKKFPRAQTILVDDKSGGCGAMFEIYVETGEFKNLPVFKQHKMIYDALRDQIKVIHGLRVITKAA